MAYDEGCHPFYPYTEQDKQGVRREISLKESTIQNDVDALIEWFEKQPHLISAGLPDRDFLERMLINAKGSREKTKRRIDNFYRYRTAAPEIIQNREEYLKLNSDIWNFYVQVAMPKLFDYKRVTIVKFTDPDPNKIETEVMFKNTFILGDIRMKYDYMLGDVWILDLTHISIGHLFRLNPVIFAKASRIFLEGIGIRLHAIHVLGAPSFAAQLIQFVSKFAKPKIIERIVTHNSLEELYQHVPKEYLPKDYGGEQPSLGFLKEKILTVLRTDETKKFLAESSKMISDETQRPGDYIDDEFLNGSFKKLDLD